MAKKNRYLKKALQKEVLDGVTSEQSKGSIKKTSIETGRDILFGAIGGGLAGAVLGRASFLVGIAVTGVGHYMGSDGTASFGVGMMASGGYQAVTGAMSGTQKEGFEGVKERMIAFKDELKKKLFLDKIIKPKAKEEKDEATNGVGEVQYFTYPNGKELEGPMDELNRIEQKIIESGKAFERKQSGEMNGEDEFGMIDQEQNF